MSVAQFVVKLEQRERSSARTVPAKRRMPEAVVTAGLAVTVAALTAALFGQAHLLATIATMAATASATAASFRWIRTVEPVCQTSCSERVLRALVVGPTVAVVAAGASIAVGAAPDRVAVLIAAGLTTVLALFVAAWNRRGRRTVIVCGDESLMADIVTELDGLGWVVTGWARDADDLRLLYESGAAPDEFIASTSDYTAILSANPDLGSWAGTPRFVVPGVNGRKATMNQRGRLAFIDPFGDPLPTMCRLTKRAFDVTVAVALLIVTAPVIAASAVAIMIESRGGWLIRQERAGMDGRPFRMLKLRTMRAGAPADDAHHRAYVAALIRGEAIPAGGFFKIVDDRRITRLGRVLRRLSIDELPQLWNVVRGDMSLVGPRPPLAHETPLYTLEHWGRLRSRPGLTGLWQVSGRSRLNFAEMVALDVKYWQSWTPFRDLRILLSTPAAVFLGRDTA